MSLPPQQSPKRLLKLVPELLPGSEISSNEPEAWSKFIEDAENAVATATPSVTSIPLDPPDFVDPRRLNLYFLNDWAREYEVPPPSRNDFRSISTYYWPNPDTQDGLPYQWRGAINPESLEASRILDDFVSLTNTLTEAWLITRETRYAEPAIRHLENFFLEPSTRMTPHMTYAQHMPGEPPMGDHAHPRLVGFKEGRPFYVSYGGMVSTSRFTLVAQNIQLLAKDGLIDSDTLAGLHQWFRDYLNWMQTSQMGRDEATAWNNHATTWHAQAAEFAKLTEQHEVSQSTCGVDAKTLLLRQVDQDGSQPHELGRHVSWKYVGMNTSAFFNLALSADEAGLNLWHYEIDGTRGIQSMAQWIYERVNGETTIEGQNVEGIDYAPVVPLLLLAGIKLRKPEYIHAVEQLPEYSLEHRYRILYSTDKALEHMR